MHGFDDLGAQIRRKRCQEESGRMDDMKAQPDNAHLIMTC